VKVAGCVIMCGAPPGPYSTDPVTQVSTVPTTFSDPTSNREQWMGFCVESSWCVC
jgi:hypothetical protein